MTNHDYLLSVLNSQDMLPADLATLQRLKGEIQGVLEAHHRDDHPQIYYAGSFGKNTMIRESFDLDIVIYFPHTITSSLQEIYNSVWQSLTMNKYIVKPKNVALRLPYEGGFHIDVVPGRAQDKTFNYTTLYKYEEGTTMQTSLKKHIESVQPVKNTIRLLKVWRIRERLNIPTFALEQITVRALEGHDKSNFENNLLKVFRLINDKIFDMRLIDPANTNNEIKLSKEMRQSLKTSAAKGLAAKYWREIIM